MAGSDVRQLLLQVDASVAVAQRNLQNLARQVANDANSMDVALGRVDNAFKRVSKSAEESANAFIEGDRAAKSLIASIDPLFAAQQRYDRELEKANQLYRTGSLSALDFAKVQAGLKTQLDQSVGAFGRVAGTSGSLRSGMQQLSFQIGDVAQGFALGVRPMTIFAQQGGQVIQTLQLMGGGTNKFLALLGGPWGLALSAAASVLVLLSARHKDAGESVDDLVKKMRDQASQAQANERANVIWANSIDGVIDAQRRLREEAERSIGTEVILNRARLRQAQENQGRIREELAAKQREVADLEKRRNALAANLGTVSGGGSVPGTGAVAANEAALAKVNQQLKATRDRVDELKKAIADGEKTIRSAAIPVAQDYADVMTDASRRVSVAFSDMQTRLEIISRDGNAVITGNLNTLEASLAGAQKAASDAASAGLKVEGTTSKINTLTNALISGKIGPDAYTKSVNAMAKALRDAAEAAKQAKKGAGEFGRQVDFGQARSIAESAGLKVNSAYRTNAQQAALYNDPSVNRPGNPVARPGTSAHNGANGKWAIDIQITDGVTPGKIRKIFADQGVSLSKVLKEKGHFHVEGSRSEAASAENRAEREQQRQVRNDNGFEEKAAQLDGQLLAAKMDLIDDTQQQAAYAADLARAEGERVKLGIQNDVEEGKYNQAQADILKAKQDELTSQRLKNIEIRKQIDTLKEQDQNEQQASDFALERLRFQDEMATTESAHRRVQLEILDVLYAEKEAHLRLLKAQADLAGNVEEAARIQAQINNLPQQKAMDQARTREGTKGPLEDYFSGVPKTAEETAAAMERLKVQGIDGAIDSIIALSNGFESFRDTALNAIKQIIAELIRMQLMKIAMNIVGAAAGGAGGSFASSFGSQGISSGLAGAADTMPIDYGGLGSLFGAASGVVSTIGGKGGTDQNVLSINGRPQLRVSAGETLMVLPKMPKVDVPAGGRSRGGDIFNIQSTAPNSGDPRRDRRSSMQHAAILNEQIAKARRNGISA